MKSLVVGVSMALVFGLAVCGSAAETKPAVKAASEHHLTGCLQKGSEPNTFKLTGVTSEHAKGMKEWELIGAPADLKLSDHVGHIEVSKRAASGKQRRVRL